MKFQPRDFNSALSGQEFETVHKDGIFQPQIHSKLYSPVGMYLSHMFSIQISLMCGRL